MELGLLHQLPDLLLQQGQLGWVQGLALVVLVRQLLHPGDQAVAVRRGHGRYQVVDDGSVAAPLGLGALAGVVDDERVEERDVLQGHFGVAGVGQPDALAGKPLQSAVFAHVDHGVGPPYVPDPAVVGEVMMGGGQVGAVVDGDGPLPKPPRWLQPDENVAQLQAGHRQLVIGAVDLARRLSPGLLELILHLGGKTPEPTPVLGGGHMAHRQPQLLLGKVIAVVAATLDEAVYQLIPVFGYVRHLVAGLFEGPQDVNDRRRGVQPHGVADAGILGGVVAQDDGDALFPVGF